MNEKRNQRLAQRPPRPMGVSILTILLGVVAGFYPIISIAFSFMQSDQTTLPLCIPLAISSVLIFTAIGTYRGHDLSRLGFIMVVIIYYSLLILNELSLLSVNTHPDEIRLQSYGRILRHIVIIIINTWYFLRKKTLEFYRYAIE